MKNSEDKEVEPSILGIRFKGVGGDGPILLPLLGIYVPRADMSAPLKAEISRYNTLGYLECVSGIMSVRYHRRQQFIEEMTKANSDPRENLRDFQIAYLTRILLESDSKWDAGIRPGVSDIVEHCEWAVNSWCDADRTFLQDESLDFWPYLWRAGYQQFKDLEGDQGLVRSLVIYRELAPMIAKHHHYQLDEQFEKATGFGLNEFWLISAALYGWILENPGRHLDPVIFSRSEDFPALTEDVGRRFLDLISMDRSDFQRKVISERTSKEGYENYALNPLIGWPLVRLPDKRYIAPVPRLILRRASEGIFYDLISKDTGPFGAILGKSFEEYTGLILNGLSGVPQLFSEMKYVDGHGNPQLTCDWIILDGDTVILIECKRSAVKAMAKITGDPDIIRNDLNAEHGIVDGVAKIYETEKSIRSLHNGLERLRGIKKFYGILVTLDDFYLPNSPVIRDIVSSSLEKKGIAPLENRIQFAHISGLGLVASVLALPGSSISALMERKTATDQNSQLDFKNFISEYASQTFPGQNVDPWMPIFDVVWNKFRTDAISIFRDDRLPPD